MKMNIYRRTVALILIAFSYSFAAPAYTQAQTITSTQQTVVSGDQVKLQLIQLLIQMIQKYQAQLAEMQAAEQEESAKDDSKPVEREVITLTSQRIGEWTERSEDLSKTITLAVFDVYAEKEDLDGTTFRATVRDIPYGAPRIMYTCSDLIEKGETKSCRIKIENVSGYSAIKYKITDVIIEAVDGTEYKNKFPAVEGYIADQ